MQPGTGGPVNRWWTDPGRVGGYVDGVFEGGGAKGVLYVGALRGVLRRKLWFSSVAGSSAGAITAAMIAAGMEPEEMEAQREPGLEVMARPTTLRGLRRVRRGTGFLDQGKVMTWLQELLRDRCKALGLDVGDAGPTFEALFDLTGIELFVAAVDLRARHLAVFHHALTPGSHVAEAVMASATIPVAFEPMVFQSTLDGDPRWRLFVDGGVASNYPSFVFLDAGFRRYAGLEDRPPDAPLVGFLLDESSLEQREETRDVYRNGTFLGAYNDSLALLRSIEKDAKSSPPDAVEAPVRTSSEGDTGRDPSAVDTRAEGRRSPTAPDAAPLWRRVLRVPVRAVAGLLGAIELVVLKPVTWLGIAVEETRPDDGQLWRWKEPKNRHARLWINAIRHWLATSSLPLFLGIAGYTAMFWLGFVVAAGYVWPDLAGSSPLGFVIGVLFSLAAFVLAALVWLFGLVTFLSFRVAYRTVGMLGSDVFQTYLNTSAPPWAGCAPNEHLIRLEVPPGVTTMKVDASVDVESVLDGAEDTAFRSLADVHGRVATLPP